MSSKNMYKNNFEFGFMELVDVGQNFEASVDSCLQQY